MIGVQGRSALYLSNGFTEKQSKYLIWTSYWDNQKVLLTTFYVCYWKSGEKTKKQVFLGGLLKPIFWPDGLNFEKSCVWSKVGSSGVKNFHFWNFLNNSSLSWDIGLLAWTPIKNENKTSFQTSALRLSKWCVRFFWVIFLRLDSTLTMCAPFA